jgi:hypothetical protein
MLDVTTPWINKTISIKQIQLHSYMTTIITAEKGKGNKFVWCHIQIIVQSLLHI